MSISLKCPGCGKAYKVREDLAGKRVKCKCGQAITIPAPAAAAEAEPETYDLAPTVDPPPTVGATPMIDPGAMSDLLDGELAADAKQAAAASQQAPPAAEEFRPAREEVEEPAEKRGGGFSNSAAFPVLCIGGVLTACAVVAIVVVWMATRPGFGSPEDAYAKHQNALRYWKWSELIETHTAESQETIVVGMIDALDMSESLTIREIRAVFEKYGIQPEQTHTIGEPPKAIADVVLPEPEPDALLLKPRADAEWFEDADVFRKRLQRRRQMISGIEDRAAFYVDLRKAVHAVKKKKFPPNPAMVEFKKKPEEDYRKAISEAPLENVNIDGDSASATITFRPPHCDPLTVPIHFRQVDGRWYVHFAGDEAYVKSPFPLMMGSSCSWMPMLDGW